MEISYKFLMVTLSVNLILGLIMSIININMGLIVFVIGTIIIPVFINVILILFAKIRNQTFAVLFMSIFNVIYYVLVMKSTLNNPNFTEIAESLYREKDGFYIEMNTELLSVSQISFAFICYFVFTFLLAKFIKMGVKTNVKAS